jgi:DNA-binding NarL/FixJ family response regulator
VDAGVPGLVLFAMVVVGMELTTTACRQVARQPGTVVAAIMGKFIVLPVVGRRLAARVMGRHRDLRLIVLNVHVEPRVVSRMLSGGVAGFVLKRAVATDLILADKEVFRGGTYICPALHRLLPESGEQSLTAAKGAPPGGMMLLSSCQGSGHMQEVRVKSLVTTRPCLAR